MGQTKSTTIIASHKLSNDLNPSHIEKTSTCASYSRLSNIKEM